MYKQKIDSGVQFKSTTFCGAHFEITQQEPHSYKIDGLRGLLAARILFWGKGDFFGISAGIYYLKHLP